MLQALRQKVQKGIAALMFVVTVLGVVTVITLFTSDVIITDNKIYNNVQNNAYALNAAQAGVDYALAYLNVNPSTVTTGLASCATATNTYSLTSGTLPSSGATYTMTYSCVTAGSTSTLRIASTGTSADGGSTRTLGITVMSFGGSSTIPVMAKGTVTAASSAVITNSLTGATYAIDAGGTVASVGATLTPAATNSFDTALSGLTTAQLETNFAGRSIASFATLAPSGAIKNVRLSCASTRTFNATTLLSTCTVNLNNTGSTTLSGITNAVIYINMNGNALTLTQGANNAFTLGSAASKVILVVDNASLLTIRGTGTANTTIYGNVYTDSPVTLTRSGSSTVTINGMVFSSSAGTTRIQNSADVNGIFVGNSTVVVTGSGTRIILDTTSLAYITGSLGGYVGTYATNGPSGGGGGGGASYGLVSGSWKDF